MNVESILYKLKRQRTYFHILKYLKSEISYYPSHTYVVKQVKVFST